jgi:ribosomal protein S18 acetylase RimI-like enzyme
VSAAAPFAVRRLADATRIEELHALVQATLGALAIDPPSSVRKETVADFAARFGREIVLVADAGEGLIGGMFCAPQHDALYVGRLAVAPGWRRRGVASALIDAAKNEARAAGARRITLKVRIALPDNVALFRRHGFVITAQETHAGYSAPTSYAMELAVP